MAPKNQAEALDEVRDADATPVEETDEEILGIDTTNEGDWEVLVEETPYPITLEKAGERIIGTYLGERRRMIVDRDDQQEKEVLTYLFRSPSGKPLSINASYKLEEAMGAVKVNDYVRITLAKLIPMPKGRNDLKDYQIDIRRPKSE